MHMEWMPCAMAVLCGIVMQQGASERAVLTCQLCTWRWHSLPLMLLVYEEMHHCTLAQARMMAYAALQVEAPEVPKGLRSRNIPAASGAEPALP